MIGGFIFMVAFVRSTKNHFLTSGKTTHIDFVDPSTAEVVTVDGLQHVLITHCAKQPDFISKKFSIGRCSFQASIGWW